MCDICKTSLDLSENVKVHFFQKSCVICAFLSGRHRPIWYEKNVILFYNFWKDHELYKKNEENPILKGADRTSPKYILFESFFHQYKIYLEVKKNYRFFTMFFFKKCYNYFFKKMNESQLRDKLNTIHTYILKKKMNCF